MTEQAQYDHTQKAPLGLMLKVLALFFVFVGVSSRQPALLWISLTIAVITACLSFMFEYLRVLDEGEHLGIHFGPWRVFSTRIAYNTISHVEKGRSSFIDGWGIHYVPFRGWTYNLWGFDCAKLTVNGRPFRIGSDDVANLVAFIDTKVADRER